MFHMPISSPMMKTIFGCCPDGGVRAGCCACAVVVTPEPSNAVAATSDVPLNSRSRRLSPSLFCVMSSLDFPRIESLVMTRSLSVDFCRCIESRHGLSKCRSARHGAQPGGSGGNNWERTIPLGSLRVYAISTAICHGGPRNNAERPLRTARDAICMSALGLGCVKTRRRATTIE